MESSEINRHWLLYIQTLEKKYGFCLKYYYQHTISGFKKYIWQQWELDPPFEDKFMIELVMAIPMKDLKINDEFINQFCKRLDYYGLKTQISLIF